MTCDEVQVSVLCDEQPSAEALSHRATCPACQAFLGEAQGAVALAQLPAVSAAERAALASLPVSALSQWRRDEGRRSGRAQWARLATAAGLGAAVAAGAMWALMPVRVVVKPVPVPSETMAARALPDGFGLQTDDEMGADGPEAYEVYWPELQEGEDL